MTYPADIVRAVAADAALAARFPGVAALAEHDWSRPHDPAFDRWLCSPEARGLRPVARYRHYLATLRAVIDETIASFDALNRRSGSEYWQRATGRYELLHLASVAYLVDSWDVPGVILECGAYTGFSSAILSWACDLLGRELYVADSFEGIPDLGQAPSAVFQPGSYACGEDVVRANLETLGRPDRAHLVRGWFSESLREFDRPIAMLWMDVDLEQSVVDVLDNTFDQLSHGAAVCCHEFLPSTIEGDRIVAEEFSPAGVRRSLESRDLDYVACHVTSYTGIIEIPAVYGDSRPPYVPEFTDRVLALTTPIERAKSAVRAAARASRVLERESTIGAWVRRWLDYESRPALRDIDISPRVWR